MTVSNLVGSIGSFTTSPPVVVASSLATIGATSFVENWMSADHGLLSNLATIKLMNLVAYVLCIFAVQQPGRIDGKAGDAAGEQEKASKLMKSISIKDNKDLTVEEMMFKRRQSLFVPSGWAFAIWGVIFLGELIFVASSALLVKEGSDIAPLYRKVSRGFVLAQLCQTMWTQAFRPHIYKDNLIYLSSLLLSGIAFSLNQAHAQFALATSEMVKWYEYLLYFLPMSLHFGWTTAASLVNWNGNVAYVSSASTPRLVAVAGHTSALLAAGLGVGLTLVRRAPVFGCVVAWALTAVSTEMTERFQLSSSQHQPSPGRRRNSPSTFGLVGARVQKWICRFGAACSFAASIYVVLATQKTSSMVV
ncbi:hypothetical protein ACA910_010492 [Epithemia clementina (nom. ined.)]